MTIVELHMNIDYDGCEENVRKALLKLEGVHYVNVDRLHGPRQGDSDGLDQPEEGAPSGEAVDGEARRAVAVGVQPRLRAAGGLPLPPAVPRRARRCALQRRRRRLGGGSEAGGAAVPQGELLQLPRARLLRLRSLREPPPRAAARRRAGRRAELLQQREPECLLDHVMVSSVCASD